MTDQCSESRLSARLAPIAVFAYRRPAHLLRTLQALLANPEAAQTELFVFCDAARNAAAADDVETVRRLVGKDLGFREQHVIYRDENFGLARNITDGISHVLRDSDAVIVIEDDIVVSRHFLRYMNDALQLYASETRVGSVSGYSYPLSSDVPDTYFIRGADCWGWATWRDRWSDYNPDGRDLVRQLSARDMLGAFDFDGVAGFGQMLEDQIAGRNDSWAVRWHASCYLRDRLILYPRQALAQNIGNDGTGTHSSVFSDRLDVVVSAMPVKVGGIAVEENDVARGAIKRFFQESSLASETVPEAASAVRAAGYHQLMRRGVMRCLPEPLKMALRHLRSKVVSGPPGSSTLSPVAGSGPVVSPGDHADASPYWGLNELDRQIEKHLDFDGGYFVELGANNGRFQSNTLYFETKRNWRGVLIEPAPNLFLQCLANRSRENAIFCAACVAFDYADEFVKLIYSNAMSVSLNLESDIGDPAAHAELGRQFLTEDETVFSFGAVARTLDSILIEARAPDIIDFLSLDVEGAEIEVLKGVRHDRVRFRKILVECRDIARLSEYLTPLKYRLIEKFNEHDYLFAWDEAVG